MLSLSFGVTSYCFVSKDLLIFCRSFSKIHQRNVRESFWLILPGFNVNLNTITISVIFRQFNWKLRFKTFQTILFLSVLDSRVCHTMDVLCTFISVLYDSVFFRGSFVHVLLFSILALCDLKRSPVCTWHCSLHCLFMKIFYSPNKHGRRVNNTNKIKSTQLQSRQKHLKLDWNLDTRLAQFLHLLKQSQSTSDNTLQFQHSLLWRVSWGTY